MKQRIRACRIVLSNGCVIMDYFHNGTRGMAFAGLINENYDNLWNGSRSEFKKSCKDWITQNKDNEEVESIEIF